MEKAKQEMNDRIKTIKKFPQYYIDDIVRDGKAIWVGDFTDGAI